MYWVHVHEIDWSQICPSAAEGICQVTFKQECMSIVLSYIFTMQAALAQREQRASQALAEREASVREAEQWVSQQQSRLVAVQATHSMLDSSAHAAHSMLDGPARTASPLGATASAQSAGHDSFQPLPGVSSSARDADQHHAARSPALAGIGDVAALPRLAAGSTRSPSGHVPGSDASHAQQPQQASPSLDACTDLAMLQSGCQTAILCGCCLLCLLSACTHSTTCSFAHAPAGLHAGLSPTTEIAVCCSSILRRFHILSDPAHSLMSRAALPQGVLGMWSELWETEASQAGSPPSWHRMAFSSQRAGQVEGLLSAEPSATAQVICSASSKLLPERSST